MLFSARIVAELAAAARERIGSTAVMASSASPLPEGHPATLASRGPRCRERVSSRRFVAGLGTLRPGLVLGDVVLGGRVEQRNHLVLDGRDPVGDLDPLGAVPLLHVRRMMAVVVVAGHIDRRAEALE